MKVKRLHPWNLDYEHAASLQVRLSRRITLAPFSLRRVEFVAGADVAVSKRLDRLVAAVVVMTFPGLEVIECRTADLRPPFPYVPGFLSFRELPVLSLCLEKVRTPFQALICDGQGIAHPRRFGLASHAGLALGIPAIGCAKSRLVGEHGEVGKHRGDYAKLRLDTKQVGSVLRTRDGVKPVFVSPGHLIDHRGSRRAVLECLTRYRLPEPTRLAHIAAGDAKRSLEKG